MGIKIYKVTFYDCMSNPKVCYCFGLFAAVQNWVNSLPDAFKISICEQDDLTLLKPTGFVTLVNCCEE